MRSLAALVVAAACAAPRAAAPSGEGAPPEARVADYRCGDAPVSVAFEGDEARLSVGGRYPGDHVLTRARAADGVLYERLDEAGRVSLRGKGDEARLSVNGRELPTCRADGTAASALSPVTEASALLGEWVVEDVEGRGVVDRARASLAFGVDGTLSGSATCNRVTGPYALGDGRLSVGPLAVTRRLCPPALMTQEARVLSVLEAASEARLSEDGALTIIASDGRALTARRS